MIVYNYNITLVRVTTETLFRVQIDNTTIERLRINLWIRTLEVISNASNKVFTYRIIYSNSLKQTKITHGRYYL